MIRKRKQMGAALTLVGLLALHPTTARAGSFAPDQSTSSSSHTQNTTVASFNGQNPNPFFWNDLIEPEGGFTIPFGEFDADISSTWWGLLEPSAYNAAHPGAGSSIYGGGQGGIATNYVTESDNFLWAFMPPTTTTLGPPDPMTGQRTTTTTFGTGFDYSDLPGNYSFASVWEGEAYGNVNNTTGGNPTVSLGVSGTLAVPGDVSDSSSGNSAVTTRDVTLKAAHTGVTVTNPSTNVYRAAGTMASSATASACGQYETVSEQGNIYYGDGEAYVYLSDMRMVATSFNLQVSPSPPSSPITIVTAPVGGGPPTVTVPTGTPFPPTSPAVPPGPPWLTIPTPVTLFPPSPTPPIFISGSGTVNAYTVYPGYSTTLTDTLNGAAPLDPVTYTFSGASSSLYDVSTNGSGQTVITRNANPGRGWLIVTAHVSDRTTLKYYETQTPIHLDDYFVLAAQDGSPSGTKTLTGTTGTSASLTVYPTFDLACPTGVVYSYSGVSPSAYSTTANSDGSVTVTRMDSTTTGYLTITGDYKDANGHHNTNTYVIGFDNPALTMTAPSWTPPYVLPVSGVSPASPLAFEFKDASGTVVTSGVTYTLTGTTAKVTSTTSGGVITLARASGDNSEGIVTVHGAWTQSNGYVVQRTAVVDLAGTFSINPHNGTGPISADYALYSGDTAYFESKLDGVDVATSAYSSWTWIGGGGGGGYGGDYDTTYHNFNQNYEYCSTTRSGVALPTSPTLMTVYCGYTSAYTGISYYQEFDLDLM